MDMKKVGEQIAALRRANGLTQNELGERLGVSFQSVSKWERGETLPVTAILLDLAQVLRTTVDHLLSGGEKVLQYKGKITVENMRQGMECLRQMGQLLGTDHLIYRAAVEGVNQKLDVDVEEAFSSDWIFECFVAEAVIQSLMAGAYVDITDVKNSFKYEHFRDIVSEYAKRYGIV